MAITHSAEQSVARIYPPLTLMPGITVEGNVSDVQQYNIATNLYEPDYTLTNLVLKPSLEVSDPSGEIPDGPGTLANMKWTLLEDGASTAITASTPGFSAGADGRLTVKRNCQGQNPMTLRFEGEYLDTRTGKVFQVMESHQVSCQGVSERPVLSLDTSGIVTYDPIRDGEKIRKVRASLKIGGTEVAPDKRILIWQKRDSDGVWADIKGDTDPTRDIMDYDVSLSADGTELTVKLWLIGYRIDVRCYAKYSPFGSPEGVAIDTRTPMAEFTAERIVGRLRGYVKGARKIRPGMRSITCEAVIWDSKGVIPNPDEVCDIEWRVASGTASGALTYGAVVERGAKVSIPTTFVAAKYGGKIKPFFGAKDPYSAIIDAADGKILTDNGYILVTH